jgi:hypothetical protein
MYGGLQASNHLPDMASGWSKARPRAGKDQAETLKPNRVFIFIKRLLLLNFNFSHSAQFWFARFCLASVSFTTGRHFKQLDWFALCDLDKDSVK